LSGTAAQQEIIRKTASVNMLHEPRSTLWEKPVPLQTTNK
jgi:hypothetical protein